ncbi:amino acid transporter [Xylanimonas sp. McL0601]|uniref:amino acid transporter n=1 Tax=Xylanimonas sp. McL0601 TaxID=3414739 RepID=UPI003CF47D7F
MCLTGLDYFSTLGYQPAIAALAAGLVAPIATLVLVALTLLGALPVYRRVAKESPHGEGSLAMLERLVPSWGGKLVVLVLLGFAATDFMITITLSAADATAHIVENPFTPSWFQGHEVPITLVFCLLLGAVFFRGFREAISIATVLVTAFLAVNVVVVVRSFWEVARHPVVVGDWWHALFTTHSSMLGIVLVALVVFPKLALGLSGFETGVVVMPQITGDRGETEDAPHGRIRGARRLLLAAALIMSTMLIASSVVTTLLIPQEQFQPGGQAYGRALAYLAHALLGEGFGTVYDVSTILILWFAGGSAMAGMLNLIPRYLPRYGMAPQWAGATRPLVLILTAIALVITIIFRASVDAQGGAYATGVLVLITSAAVAVTISARRRRQRRAFLGFAAVTAVFLYTTVLNVFERPEGVKIATVFIAAIILTSLLSRVLRSFEVRARSVTLDDTALAMVQATADRGGTIRIIAKEPASESAPEYLEKLRNERRFNGIPLGSVPLFLEVHHGDASDFEEDLEVTGTDVDGYQVLHVTSGSVPNAIASVLFAARDATGIVPEIYFEWSEGNPVRNMLRFLFLGTGEISTVTHEVLRATEPHRSRRPHVHVG